MLSSVRGQLDRMTVHLSDGYPGGDDIIEYTAAWDKCVKIRKLTFEASSEGKLEAIVATPKPNFKEVTIDWYAEDHNDMNKVRAI